MRRRDERKRKLIVEVALRLFSQQPFHKVKLDEVAAAAGVGKGTLYIYFKNKEDLYYSLIYDGFADLVERLGEKLRAHPGSAIEQITAIVHELVTFSIHYPQLYEAMRTVAPPGENSQWDEKRRELMTLITEVLRKGAENGTITDARPDLSALYFTAMVRAAMLFGPKDLDGEMLAEHISGILLHGLGRKQA